MPSGVTLYLAHRDVPGFKLALGECKCKTEQGAITHIGCGRSAGLSFCLNTCSLHLKDLIELRPLGRGGCGGLHGIDFNQTKAYLIAMAGYSCG